MRYVLLLLAPTLLLGCDVDDTGTLGGRPDPLVDCAATPDEPSCACAEGSTRDALHWTPRTFVARADGRRCLEVVVHPSLEPFEPEIARGLGVWEGVGCSGLCFAGPTPGLVDRNEPETGLVYVVPAERGGASVTNTSISFEQDSLQIVGAVVALDAGPLGELDDEARAAVVAGELGRALGLPGAPPNTPSILASRLDDLVAAPTAEDEAVFCKAYGEGGVCGIR